MEPFRVDVPDEVLNDLQVRLKLTRWADDFANEGWQYGTNTDYLKELVAYWIKGYDWRKQERAINAYPQFRTEIDGVPIPFIHVRGKGPNPKRSWVLDADLAAAFDRIDHDHLLAQLGTFPARELVAQWLRAGVVEAGRFTPTGEGTPQGGVISPALMNVALHGMEQAAGVRYPATAGILLAGVFMVVGGPLLMRYLRRLMLENRAGGSK